LSREPSSAQAQILEHAYIYAGNNPLLFSDPSGLKKCFPYRPENAHCEWPDGCNGDAVSAWLGASLLNLPIPLPADIEVVPISQRLRPAVNCGDRAFIDWQFRLKLKKGAPCNGFFVQKIDYYCDVQPCTNCPNALPAQPSLTYYEAWFVEEKGTHTADHAAETLELGKCGVKKQVGTVKFFCDTITRDLRKLWPKNKIYGHGDCQITPRSLPSTVAPPLWWNIFPVAGPARRWLSANWICDCPCMNNFADADAEPRKKAGIV
jgi:hypothetical protein